MNPMRPRDKKDTLSGWVYTIVVHWQDAPAFARDYGNGRVREESDTIAYAATLADAQWELAAAARRVEADRGVPLRALSKNRFYGSDGEQQITVCVRAVPDF